MRHVSWIVLLVSFRLASPAFADSQDAPVVPPAFALRSVPFEIEITKGGSYAIFHEGGEERRIAEGVCREPLPCKVSLTLEESGFEPLRLTLGRESVRFSIRVMPGWISILPPLLAIGFAIWFREVVLALFFGIWFGATCIFTYNPFTGLLRSVDHYVLESLTKDAGHVTIILFSLLLGGMVGVIAKSGASWAIAEKVSRYATTPRRGQLIGWVLGLLIFFDDYANALICGSTLRPITDRLRISREKLAYIVDSTAAPVASLAIISTWIGTEIGYIGDQLTTLGIEGDPYLLFLKTIPFRFYPILALFLGFMVAATGRDFGPMAAAEVRARKGEGVVRKGAALLTEFAEEETRKRSGVWYHAAIPIAVVVFVMLGGLYVTGWQAVNGGKDLHVETLLGQAAAPTALNLLAATWLGFLVFLMFAAIVVKKQGFRLDNPRGRWYLLILDTIALGGILILLHETYGFVTTCPASLREIFGRADSYAALIWASFLGSITALLLVTGERVMRLRQAIEAWLSGMKSMMLAVVVLTLAWSLGSICSDLQTSAYLVGLLEGSFPPKLLPMMVFAVSAAISFATGTSWGTMGILFPIVVPLAHHLAPGNELILVGTISSILAGSVFGDHCSPISDTTIMSSMASSSDHIDHVKTQIPYALLAGIVGMILGDLATACHLYGAWTALFLSGGVITLFLFLFGRKVDAPPPK